MSDMLVPLYPYYGVAPKHAVIDTALVFNLGNRGPSVTRSNPSMHCTDGPDTSIYYAYPAAYGPAIFQNLITGESIGWDGAFRDSGATTGPRKLDLYIKNIIVPFYIYQTTIPNLSPAREIVFWKVL